VSLDAPSAQRKLLARARELPSVLANRTAERRASVLERRVGAFALDFGGTAEARGEPDMDVTMRTAWQLIGSLRASLLSLEERATRVVPAEVAGLVALWTQLDTFDSGAPRGLAWAAWGVLLLAILALAKVVMPSRLAKFWDSLVPPEVVLADAKPLRHHDEAAIARWLSAELHAQTDRLRRGFRLTVVLSGCALVLAAVAYVIDKW
jgi:hypothetical protein